MMYAVQSTMYAAQMIALGSLFLFVGCTEPPPRPAPQPAPAPPAPESAPQPTQELRAERGSLRLGFGPAKHRLPIDAGLPAEAPAPPEPPGFLGEPERALLEQLRSGAITSVKKSGGRALAFELTFDSGAQGYYKPELRGSSASWYAEIAAYYLDRALGLGRVPPLVARKLPWSQLSAAVSDDPRHGEVVVGDDGQVRGALIQRLNENPVPAVTPPGWENWIHRTSPKARYVQTPEPNRSELPAELSDMIVFDFLTRNHNATRLTLGPAGPLIALENGAAFSPAPARRSALDARLSALAKFRRRTIGAVRALDVPALGVTMAADPLGPFLDANMLRDLEARRTALLEHVAKQERRYGAEVYAW